MVFDKDVQEQQCQKCPEDSGAAFVERRDIPLWWVFYDLHNAIGTNNGVMYDLCAPTVAVLGASEVNGIATLSFAHEHAIPHHNGIHRANNIEQL